MILREDGPYTEGDIVLLTHINVEVARYLFAHEAEQINAGKDPWGTGLTRVRRPTTKTHYYSQCAGQNYSTIARTIRATTCRRCLKKRAKQLSANWKSPCYVNEVAWLTKLGFTEKG